MYKYLNVTVTLLTHPNLIMSFVISILIRKNQIVVFCVVHYVKKLIKNDK